MGWSAALTRQRPGVQKANRGGEMPIQRGIRVFTTKLHKRSRTKGWHEREYLSNLNRQVSLKHYAPFDDTGEIPNSRVSRGKCETRNGCGVALGIDCSSYAGTGWVRRLDACAHCCWADSEPQQHRSISDCFHHRFGYARRKKCRCTVERFRGRHAERPNRDLGHLQHPGFCRQRVYGNCHGDLDHRYDKNGRLAD
jgi:hypothetical protein